MRARGGVRRGFTRLSDRVGGVATIPAAARYIGVQNVISAFTFTAVTDGPHTFWAWGPGAGFITGGSGGGSGAFARKTVNLSTGDQVSISIGKTRVGSTAGDPTTVTFASILSIICGAGPLSGSATATGGDVNVAGAAGVINGNGGTAPGDTYFSGGLGGTVSADAQWPGAGGYSNRVAGQGGVVIAYAREAPL